MKAARARKSLLPMETYFRASYVVAYLTKCVQKYGLSNIAKKDSRKRLRKAKKAVKGHARSNTSKFCEIQLLIRIRGKVESCWNVKMAI